MRKMLLVLLVITYTAQAQQNYVGNGRDGFDGDIGNGTLQVNDDGTNISLSLSSVTFNTNDILVIYFNSVGNAGFSSTASLNDRADGGRVAVSGVSNTERSILNFPDNFGADYALAWGNFGSALFQLAAGDNSSLVHINSDGSTSSRTIAKSAIGITGSIRFQMVTSYISNSAFRSNEAFIEPMGEMNPGYNDVTFGSILGYPDITLNASISQFGAAWQASQGARLNWQINCSSGNVSMKLERSLDGRNFEVIHSESASAPRCAAPFTYNDMQAPASGAFYRLAIQNDNGRIHYSKVARLQKNTLSAKMMLTPTLAQSEVWLQTQLGQPDVLTMRLMDANGKLIRQYRERMEAGTQNLRLIVDQLPPAIYYLQVKANKSAIAETLRFVKQ